MQMLPGNSSLILNKRSVNSQAKCKLLAPVMSSDTFHWNPICHYIRCRLRNENILSAEVAHFHSDVQIAGMRATMDINKQSPFVGQSRVLSLIKNMLL